MTYSNRSYVEVEKTILISFDYYYQKIIQNAYVITNCTCEKTKKSTLPFRSNKIHTGRASACHRSSEFIMY
jgi:hypothetical protein